MSGDFFSAFDQEWRSIRRSIEELMEVWSYEDSAQREFRQRYWGEIVESTDRYLGALRELSATIAELSRRDPCR